MWLANGVEYWTRRSYGKIRAVNEPLQVVENFFVPEVKSGDPGGSTVVWVRWFLPLLIVALTVDNAWIWL